MKENVDPFEGIDAVSETIFNYDLGMMKENLYPKKKKVQVSKKDTNKENVDPEDQMAAQKLKTPQSAKRKLKENVDPEDEMGAQKLKTPQSAKRYSPRSPLSTLSNDCRTTSRIPNKKRVLNCKKKNMDSTIPETSNSTLTSMFNSNVKESGLEENGFSLNCCNSTVQTLDFGMNTEFSESHRTVDEIDFPWVVGFEADEPDMFSEDEDTEDLDCWSYDNQQKAENVPCDYASLGPPEVKCDKCEAWMWKEEHTNKNVKHGPPQFSLCCAKGQIQLPKENLHLYTSGSYIMTKRRDQDLRKVRGPTSYKCLRTVNGIVYSTFQEACKEYGLLDDDNE
ncbi:hypothetical protein POM88_014060 [Heracleum sosnowskyi]|uniref:Uncharacterized protein n=1 Tax=Heracleum sosnowskyi TaxID=360622 RepID=A0AAD8IZP9_9APIA|nr:hypothetical protein POM88_014060 [Heracleum sosnowskyi]